MGIMGDTTIFYRLQDEPEFQTSPSWDAPRSGLEVENPCEEYPGFYWAYDEEAQEWLLVREEDAERADAGEEVDAFVPGLFGVDDAEGIIDYWDDYCVRSPDLWVCIYEGKPTSLSRIDGDVFEPIRLVEAVPVLEFIDREDIE